MKITFENEITEFQKTQLELSTTENGLFVDVRYLDNAFEESIDATHFLNKQQLKDFIGALLHIQSKLK